MSNACTIPCPYCGKDIDVVQSMEMLAGKEWTELLAGLPFGFVGVMLRYVELFKPDKQDLRWSRRLAITKELSPMIKAAQVKRNGIVYSAPLPIWEAEMMKLIVNPPETLVLPLKGNGYLLSMIAGRGENVARKQEQKVIEQARNRSNVGGGPVSVADLAAQAQQKSRSKPPEGWAGKAKKLDTS